MTKLGTMLDGSKRTPRGDFIQNVTSNTFDSLVLGGEGPIVVEFMSYGCEHCRAIEPILQQVAEELKPKETIYRVNVGVDEELARSYEVEGTPTFVMFLNGSEVGRVQGLRPTVSTVLAALTQAFET